MTVAECDENKVAILHQQIPRESLPRVQAIGIGAQKCASSWIHAVAGSHPGIGTSASKELDFFSYYFDRGYEWYEQHFGESKDDQIFFENSPSYFHDPRAPERARAYNPDLKIVLLLRDPLKRAFSNHLHEIIKGHIPPVRFEEGLANNPSYIEQGLYATHLGKWREAFPAEQIHVVFAEEIAADSATAASDLFRFLGVDEFFQSAILHERRNESDRARSPLLRRGLRAGGDLMRHYGLEPFLAKVKATAPVAQVLKANRIEVRNEIPDMTPETVDHLRSIFDPEMARLQAMLDRETIPWERGYAS